MVLAGGQSTRFGCDKCSFVIEGMTMLDRLVMEFDPLVVSRVRRGYKREVVEEGAYEGPLKGVRTGLGHLNSEKVFITGCDHPFLTRRVVDNMCGKEYDVVSFYDGRMQPLLSCYSVPYLRRVIPRARRLVDLIQLSDHVYYVGYYEMKMYDPLLRSIEDYDSLSSRVFHKFCNSFVYIS